MTAVKNRRILLAARPRGEPTLDDFQLVQAHVPEPGPGQMPLLRGDPAAVAVLVELLGSQDRQVRLIVAEGLEKISEPARTAVPGLLRTLDDADKKVRHQAGQALFWIDRPAAQRAGLEWGLLGLTRKEPARAKNE